jgi:hypothetical protein
VRQCQKCQKGIQGAFGTFGTPSVSALQESHALLGERRSECPGAVPVLVCHDEIVVECDVEQSENITTWLETAMIEGMEAVLNGTDELDARVEVEARIARSWAVRR